MMKKVVIVGGCRTAVGAFGGNFKDVSVVDLGAKVIHETLNKVQVRPVAGDGDIAPAQLSNRPGDSIEQSYATWDQSFAEIHIDEVIMGNVLQAGQGQNPARQAMIRAGISKETPAFTINKVCGSGLKAIALGAQSILCGQADIVLAGGQENMSQVPMALPKSRWGYRMEISGKGDICDLMVFDALHEIFHGYHMGVTAENIASLYGISRADQDALAMLSHTRALEAIGNGSFDAEIVPVTLQKRKGEETVRRDERPMETTVEKLGRLKPIFAENGTVTAGNASGINDGAAAVLLMSEERAHQLGCKPLVTIESFASGGVDPAYMGLGPVPPIRKILNQRGMKIGDVDVIELNEAFAAQTIGCMIELGLDFEKPNQRGSGISLGHPVGCTGARQMVTIMNQMGQSSGASGLISMCIGGGMGMAMLISS